MAKNFNINAKLTADTGQFTKDVSGAVNIIDKQTTQVNSSLEKLLEKAGRSDLGLKEMQKTLRDLNKISFEGLSPEAVSRIQQAQAGLVDMKGDYQNMINQMSLDPFQKMASSLQSVSTIAQGVTGSMALFGVESEGVNEAMQMTVGLMGVANSLQEISILFKEKALGMQLKEIALQIKSNGLMGLFNVIANANPIFLLVTAVAAISAGIYVWIKYFSSSAKESEKIKMNIESIEAATKAGNTAFDNQLKLMKLLKKSSDEILAIETQKARFNFLQNESIIAQLKNKEKLTDEERKQLDEAIKQREQLAFNLKYAKTAEIQNQKEINQKKAEENQKQDDANKQAFLKASEERKKLESDAAKEIEDLKYQQYLEGEKRRSDIDKRSNDLMKSLDNSIEFDNVEPIADIMFIDPTTFAQFDNNIKILQDRLKNATPEEGIEIRMNLAKLQEDMAALDLAMSTSFEKMQDSIAAASGLMGGLGDVISGNAGDWLSWGANALGVIGDLLPQLAQMIGLNIANGIAQQASLIFPYNLIAMAGTLGSVLGLIASIPKFETGGIVGGSSYTGDKVPALVNSGEMILNKGQQSNLFRMLNGGGSSSGNGGNVTFEISGNNLVGILNKNNKYNNSLR